MNNVFSIIGITIMCELDVKLQHYKHSTTLRYNRRNCCIDYRLLEETGRKVDSTTRDELKRRRDKPNFVNNLNN